MDTMKPITKKRIWILHRGSPVRLTLHADKKITVRCYRDTDEGWDLSIETFTLCDGAVFLESFHDGCDCDGRMSYENCYIMDGVVEHAGIELAYFNVTKSGPIYDQFAQAMGY